MDQLLLERLGRAEPLFWANPKRRPMRARRELPPFCLGDLQDAAARFKRFAPLLAELFPELRQSGGRVESALIPARHFEAFVRRSSGGGVKGRFLLKADHALPLAGSVKARGGFHAVLRIVEDVAVREGLLRGPGDEYGFLASDRARAVFGRFGVSVGSTGNLGLSVGIMGRAFGFNVAVHLSREAKVWKKERLRRLGVTVVEHPGDYESACDAARTEAAGNPRVFFIDDENSPDLFCGYGAAVFHLRTQLADLGALPDPDHPLCLYLPCGVGGAPGGVTFGARLVLGDDVHCFFAEPTHAPCMLLGMATGRHADISVRDLGLSGLTEADGLAVSRPSRFVGPLMEPLLDGCYTVSDATLFRDLLHLYEAEGLEIEPSAAACLSGPDMLFQTAEGREHLERTGLAGRMEKAAHVLWLTGGSLLGAERHAAFREIGRLTRR